MVYFVVVISTIYYLNGKTNHGEKIEVPDYIGKNIKQVAPSIEALQFEYEVVDSIYNPDKPEGTIVYQDPLPSKISEVFVKEGRKIRFRVSKKTKLIVEIKPSIRGKEWALATAKKVTDEIKKFKARSHVEYISFDFDICKEVLKYVPKAKVQYLNGDKTPAEIKAAGLSGLDYHYSVFQKHPEYISESKKLGLVTNAWTVNDNAVMDWMIAHKVDFITTNEPEMLFEKLQSSSNSNAYFLKSRNSWYNNERPFYINADSNKLVVNQGKNRELMWCRYAA